MKIYLITKPGTNEVYIGQTDQSLNERLRGHFKEQKIKSHREVYKWLDKTCMIELLEEFVSDKQDTFKEMTYVNYYINNGFIVKNTKLGQKILDSTKYIKEYNKEYSSKRNPLRNPEYNRWCSKISKRAKKEGLSSKEYRDKYSIPDYEGDKKIN